MIIKNQKIDDHSADVEEKKFDEDHYDDSNDSYNDTFVEANSNLEETPKTVKKGIPKKIAFASNSNSRLNRISRDELVTDDDDDDLNKGGVDLSKYRDVLLSKASDTQFGIRRKGDKLEIGSYIVDVNANRLRVRKRNFPVTAGLLDLLFYKRPPHGFTIDDLQQYKTILLLTNAHKKFFEEDSVLRNSKKSYKYTHIISPLLRSGSGIETELMSVNNNSIDYTYWDDPNELVERLRL